MRGEPQVVGDGGPIGKILIAVRAVGDGREQRELRSRYAVFGLGVVVVDRFGGTPHETEQRNHARKPTCSIFDHSSAPFVATSRVVALRHARAFRANVKCLWEPVIATGRLRRLTRHAARRSPVDAMTRTRRVRRRAASIRHAELHEPRTVHASIGGAMSGRGAQLRTATARFAGLETVDGQVACLSGSTCTGHALFRFRLPPKARATSHRRRPHPRGIPFTDPGHGASIMTKSVSVAPVTGPLPRSTVPLNRPPITMPCGASLATVCGRA